MAAELSKSYDDLRREIGWFIGQSRNPEHWDRELTRNVNDVIVTGLSNFYWYTPIQGAESHSWSFLKPSATLGVLADTDIYDLPPDFGGFYSEGFTFDSGTQAPIKLVTEEELRSLRGTLAQSATEPSYCAIRPKIANEGMEQIYEVLFYPSPTSAHTLRYRYSLIPGLIDSNNRYPYGSRLHSTTILESCLAVAQRKFLETEEDGVNHQAEFQRCLAASISRDQEFSDGAEGANIWPIEDSQTDLTLDRSDLRQRLGNQLFNKPNPGSWSHDETKEVERVLVSGLSAFYWYTPPEGVEAHTWSFLKPTASLSIVADTSTYDLPVDFGGLRLGEFTFESGTQAPIKLVSESELRTLSGTLSLSASEPSYCSIRLKESIDGFQQIYEVSFYPSPTAGHVLKYEYDVIPGFIDDQDIYPRGSRVHSDTILESCLAAGERSTGEPGAHEAEFQKKLIASIQRDGALPTGEDAHIWPIKPADTGLSLNRSDLRQRIGNQLFNKPNPGLLSHDESRTVEQAVVAGLSSFYWYTPPEGAEQHSWNFLKPSNTLALVAATDTYDLPADFGGIYSEGFTFETSNKAPIKLVSEEELRKLQSTLSQTATEPQYCAIRPKISSEGFEQFYEAIFYPSPTAAHTVRYRYSVIPGLIDDTNVFPHGSRLHSTTILEACLAAAEQIVGVPNGPHEAEFQKCLAASIYRDREISDEGSSSQLWPMNEMPTGLTLDRFRLRQRIGLLAFTKPNPGTWTHDEKSLVELILVAGLSNFYWYTSPEGIDESHTWSFLKPAANLTLLANTDTYNLPVNFGGLESGEFTFASGSSTPIKLVTDEELRAIRGTPLTATEPQYCAIRPKASSEGFEQIHEVIFYPKPTSANTLKYRYSVIPGFIDDDNVYPMGSRMYSMAILESCLASTQRELGLEGPVNHEAEFQKCLVASIRRDQKFLSAAVTTQVWPVEPDRTSLTLDQTGLRQRISIHLFNKPNVDFLSHDEAKKVEQVLITGLSSFYWYSPADGSAQHSWSFLSPTATLEIVADKDTYEFPTDFGGIDSGGFTFESGNKTPVKLVSEEELRTIRSTLSQTATEPQYCAIRPSVTSEGFEQSYEAVFYPSPTAGHSLRYRYSIIPGLVDGTNVYPYGSRLHSVTILESCLAAADQLQGKADSQHEARFQRCLSASISRDQGISDETALAHVWPIEDPPTDLALDRSRLRQRIGFLCFEKPNPGSWSHNEQSIVEQILVDGLSNFYWYTTQGEEEAHSWSFLKPSAKLSILADDDTYSLPVDFGGLESGEFTFDTGTASPIKLVEEEELRAIRGTLAQTSAEPQYCAIRPSSSIDGFEQVHEVVFYPKPAAAHTLSYRYSVIPGVVDDENIYPLGSRLYSMAILESCLASAQRELNLEKTVDHESEFRKCLTAAIRRDQKFLSAASAAHIWPIEDPISDLAFDRDGLLKRLGHYVFVKPNSGSWSHDETSQLEQILITGLTNFYWYTPVQGAEGHSWSFLSPNASLEIAANTDTYDLPADFGGLHSDTITFDSGTQAPIKLVTEEDLRSLRSTLAQTATEPSYCAIRPKVVNAGFQQVYEIVFYPKPTAAHTLRYQYDVIPGFIDAENIYPYGSRLHSTTILESCLWAADRFLNQTGPHEAEFQRCLAASINRDNRFGDAALGAASGLYAAKIWPIEDTPEDLTLNRKGLLRRIGHSMYSKPNSGGWTHDEKSQIEQAVMDGLRKFYYPMVLPNEMEMHRWSFLYPKQTFKCAADTYTYELPADFGSLKGPMHYAPGSAVLYPNVEEVSESQIEQLRQAGDHSGRTRYFAIRPLVSGEFFGTRYEILLYPVPDQAYTLHYRYEVNPKFIVQDQEHPLGGQPHAQTILEACLMSADLFMKMPQSPHEIRYLECLQASISYDRQVSSPDTLGRDYDGSDRPSDPYLSDMHDADLNLVTYTGYST